MKQRASSRSLFILQVQIANCDERELPLVMSRNRARRLLVVGRLDTQEVVRSWFQRTVARGTLQGRDAVKAILLLLVLYAGSFALLFPWYPSDRVAGYEKGGGDVSVWSFRGIRYRDIDDPELTKDWGLVILYFPLILIARQLGYYHFLLGGKEVMVTC